jgi:sec-independent protein translocase protein TatA
MNLGPLEIGFVLGIIILFFGPDKIPQLARSLGKATKEYQQAIKGISNPGKAVIEDFKGETNNSEEKQSHKSEEEQILDNAQKLGIKTEGKTSDQIIDEILKITDE